jgi:uncharacterized protein YrrD
MLHGVQGIYGFAVHASDGDVGQVHDLYFDDQDWSICYLVVNTGNWLFGRQVLLAPKCIELVRWQMREIDVSLTREQVENSPSIDLAKPVSRQMEAELHHYYGWVPYWRTGARALVAVDAQATETSAEGSEHDPHLRSTREVTGYHLQATDSEIGHVEDFFVEASCWTIHYMLVDTRKWLPGRKVLVGHKCLSGVDWAESKAYVDLTREQVEQSPEYDPEKPIARSYEIELHDHYGVPGYWLNSPL